jgi:Dyp-type peroxidase family
MVETTTRNVELELGDIQGTLLRRRPDKYYGYYILYRIDDPETAKAALIEFLPNITTAEDWEAPRPFTLNIVFTYQGLRVLGVADEVLEGFPQEFRVGMAARREVLGDCQESDPSSWIPPMGTKDVHAGVVISSRSEDGLATPLDLAQSIKGVTVIYKLDVGIPPTGREHFGFVDGIGGPFIIGSGSQEAPGQDPIMPGEFVLGYPDETGAIASLPVSGMPTKNGTFLAFRQLHANVAAFRRFIRDQAKSKEDEELVAAKIVGRWRSGAPLSLAPDTDDPVLASDHVRNNDFSYSSDPKGLRCPLGAHIRRVNPRDGLDGTIVNVKIHRVVRRGAAYGPVLPEGVVEDDGVERGIVFIFMGVSLSRQFEFVQQVWINDGQFIGLGSEKDPFVGNNDGTGIHTIPQVPIRRRLTGLPSFITVRGGEYCFLPGIRTLKWLVGLDG